MSVPPPKLSAAERLTLAREKNPLPAGKTEPLQLTGPNLPALTGPTVPLPLTGPKPVTEVYAQLTALTLVQPSPPCDRRGEYAQRYVVWRGRIVHDAGSEV